MVAGLGKHSRSGMAAPPHRPHRVGPLGVQDQLIQLRELSDSLLGAACLAVACPQCLQVRHGVA